MYVGGTDFFGYIHYLVGAFDLLLSNGATWIEINVDDRLTLKSDATFSVRVDKDELIVPFETFGPLEERHAPDATILNALSDHFHAIISDGKTETTFRAEAGERKEFPQSAATDPARFTKLEFEPDIQIFSIVEVSPTVLQSYLRRTSCLYPGVMFRINGKDTVTEYQSQNGIADLFESISTPYQILHKPVQMCEVKDELIVEAVFAFHSWSENRIWSFVNRGRVPDGGTHETGMVNAIAAWHNNLQSPRPAGILAVLTIQHPHVTYEGCIKNRIGNPELVDRVSELVSVGIKKWVSENQAEAEHLKTIEQFTFAGIW